MLSNIKPAIALLLAALFLLAGCGESRPTGDDPKEEIDMTYLILANKQSVLGETYAPAQKRAFGTDLSLYGKTVEMESAAAGAAEALLRALWAAGYTDIKITSGYRSYAYQQSLFNTYIEQEKQKHPDWSAAQCEAEVLTYSARPGTSEHQTGLCMDLISEKNVVLDESFAENPAYAYLVENAHRFGFILRYPKGKESVTGYTYEPWHYRYVGVAAATEIHERGITLEEYLAG